MPDGSGLLYSTVDLFRQSSNIFRFDFKSKQTTQVTKLDNSFARKFSISPDGQWIVYERSSTYDDDETTKKDIWIQKMDGSNSKLLVKNGESPAWGKN
jgi:Tol biopolymer transport system component